MIRVRLEPVFAWLARRLPARLRYFVVLTAIADATTGVYAATVVPKLTVRELLGRMREGEQR